MLIIEKGGYIMLEEFYSCNLCKKVFNRTVEYEKADNEFNPYLKMKGSVEFPNKFPSGYFQPPAFKESLEYRCYNCTTLIFFNKKSISL